jgi:hypothetical protein
VLAGQRVKDNGIDYNKEVESIMQDMLTREEMNKPKDIMDIIRDMEQKESKEQQQ